MRPPHVVQAGRDEPWTKASKRVPQDSQRYSKSGIREVYAGGCGGGPPVASFRRMFASAPPDLFHPATSAWFAARFGEPTEPQRLAWPVLRGGGHVLVAAPTGSGKTLAAFLAALDALVCEAADGELPDETRVVYVSPLKALSHDIRKNLDEPLEGLRTEAARLGLPGIAIRTAVRTGDTPAAERTAALKRPPHILVTTPESLFILLTSEGGRKMLSTARTLIVDEVHAVVGSKRGSHLALTIERLEHVAGRPLQRIGLSATQKPIEDVARFLVGSSGKPCAVLDTGHARRLDLAIETMPSPLAPVMAREAWDEVHDRIAALVREHRTTLVFVNTRRLAERTCRALAERLGEEHVTAHHGSLSRERRLDAEQRLKAGELKALVATSSLELGIDIGDVDLVVQVGSTRSIAALLQRVGRSGHAVRATPKGRLVPLTRDELAECVALLQCVRRGELDLLEIPAAPLDILAQQIVAEVAAAEWSEDDLLALCRRASPYRNLPRADFDAVIGMLSEGFTTRRGRRGAWIHRDEVNGRLRARRGARLAAITSGGAIPDNADYDVILEPDETRVGSVNEDFAIESIAGDIFQLGNSSWRILRVEPGKLRVEDARGAPPTIPFWLGEAASRTDELSRAVSRLREDVDRRLSDPPAAVAWLCEDAGVPLPAAEQLVTYLASAKAALSVMPTRDVLVLERFFDESGGMQLVVHSPLGARINKAWGLALRKRFCRKFNFELQAAATEDAIVLSLGPTHSFPLEDVASYLHSSTVREVLIQAMLVAPMFATRWRWNAARSLAILRQAGSRRVAPALQRMQADDLMALIFPDQLACPENLEGPREVPDHPLARQTVEDCLHEAMDVEALEELLRSLEAGTTRLVTRDLPEPSPLAAEVLSARPYAFLDDAPLEERRTQAVQQRRWLDPKTASELAALDPAAIASVRAEAFPEAASADELHDALMLLAFVTEDEGRERAWTGFLDELVAARRATRMRPTDGVSLWIAAERVPEARAAWPAARWEPGAEPPARLAARAWTPEEAAREIVRGRLEGLGPVTASSIVTSSALPAPLVDGALLALEAEGFVLRGSFTGAERGRIEWCERRLLARIHRRTLHRLRQEIEPVSLAVFQRFLLAWQRVSAGSRMAGLEGLAGVLEQLAGFEAPVAAWEADLLPARVEKYDPSWLDVLCLSGRAGWARLTPPPGGRDLRGGAPIRSTPVALGARGALASWATLAPASGEASDDGESLSSPAIAVREHLARRGASFLREMGPDAGLLTTQVEQALGELVAAGLVTCDSFSGLRALLAPQDERPAAWRRASLPASSLEMAGRWSLLDRGPGPDGGVADHGDIVEFVARSLLARYGIVFRRLLAREDHLPPWRELLRVYHRLEARGEIRGGRFVGGPSGEQFALPEAVSRLRAIRREPLRGELISLCAADPLCLLGVVLPGRRLAALAVNRLLLRDGEPIAILEGRQISFLVAIEGAARWEAEKALLRRPESGTVPSPGRIGAR